VRNGLQDTAARCMLLVLGSTVACCILQPLARLLDELSERRSAIIRLPKCSRQLRFQLGLSKHTS
jgi:hypothetical protein